MGGMVRAPPDLLGRHGAIYDMKAKCRKANLATCSRSRAVPIAPAGAVDPESGRALDPWPSSRSAQTCPGQRIHSRGPFAEPFGPAPDTRRVLRPPRKPTRSRPNGRSHSRHLTAEETRT